MYQKICKDITLFEGRLGFLVAVLKFLPDLRGKPRPSDLVAKQPLGEADELGRGWIAQTPTASFGRLIHQKRMMNL
jgi:hypothetical protein